MNIFLVGIKYSSTNIPWTGVSELEEESGNGAASCTTGKFTGNPVSAQHASYHDFGSLVLLPLSATVFEAVSLRQQLVFQVYAHHFETRVTRLS